jgi:phosphatidylserine decarboxylase
MKLLEPLKEEGNKMKGLASLFLPVLSLPVFSRMWGKITHVEHPRFLVNWAIQRYRRHYGIDMDEYEGDIGDYDSLGKFFARKLDRKVRPLFTDETAIVSPADGVLTEIETVYEDRATQVKGKYYRITELLMENIDFKEGWRVATIYLSPSNYHRFHFPITGKIKRYFHTGGRLFPVNYMGLKSIEQLFIRNERIITEIDHKGMPFFIVAVGATFVGSIQMEFIPGSGRKAKERDRWEPVNLDIRQLDEMGRFDMGSTLVLVFPSKMAEPLDGVKGKPVRVGNPIFRASGGPAGGQTFEKD